MYARVIEGGGQLFKALPVLYRSGYGRQQFRMDRYIEFSSRQSSRCCVASIFASFYNSLKVHRERLELEAQLKAAEAQQVMPCPAPPQFTRLAIPISVRTTVTSFAPN